MEEDDVSDSSLSELLSISLESTSADTTVNNAKPIS